MKCTYSTDQIIHVLDMVDGQKGIIVSWSVLEREGCSEGKTLKREAGTPVIRLGDTLNKPNSTRVWDFNSPPTILRKDPCYIRLAKI